MTDKPRAQSPKWDRLDIVRLKSGGLPMLVRCYPDASGLVEVVWQDVAGHITFDTVNEDWIEVAR